MPLTCTWIDSIVGHIVEPDTKKISRSEKIDINYEYRIERHGGLMIVASVINSTLYRWGWSIRIFRPHYNAWMAERRLSRRLAAYFGGRMQYHPSLQPPPYLSHRAFIRVRERKECGFFLCYSLNKGVESIHNLSHDKPSRAKDLLVWRPFLLASFLNDTIASMLPMELIDSRGIN